MFLQVAKWSVISSRGYWNGSDESSVSDSGFAAWRDGTALGCVSVVYEAGFAICDAVAVRVSFFVETSQAVSGGSV